MRLQRQPGRFSCPCLIDFPIPRNLDLAVSSLECCSRPIAVAEFLEHDSLRRGHRREIETIDRGRFYPKYHATIKTFTATNAIGRATRLMQLSRCARAACPARPARCTTVISIAVKNTNK